MGAVCPSCKVAIVPGYVRCPKCHAPLPHRPSTFVGGTALSDRRRFPVVAVVGVALVGAGIIIFLGVRGGDHAAKAQPSQAPVEQASEPAPSGTAEPTVEPNAPRGPDPQAVAEQLQRALRKQHLWSTVGIVGGRAEVRSSSCDDPAITPLLDAAAPGLKSAGLTKLRCVEQSGRVVTDRDL